MRSRVEDLFHKVADLSQETRVRYFDLHGVNATTQSEVLALLEFDSPSETCLKSEIGNVALEALTRFERGTSPCGPYQLGQLLGCGGMGAVYAAERIDGEIQQRVAVKLLRLGATDTRLRDRFLAERQILATLSHPNIARLLDAGHREDGQPYLVMEYVKGKAIDEYVAGFGVKRKVELFLKVCTAVAYLHRNLVVHRDLKPANILVTDEGEPKLLDFGIAKILAPVADLTVTSVRMLTPEYASPEQIAGGQLNTATDIYSAGAVLFKILTGVSPNRSAGNPVGVTESGLFPLKVLSPAKFVPSLEGDLKVIVMKALRVEPQERYATIEQFAEDLEYYLDSKPVRARKGGVWYKTRKYLRHYWLPTVAATVAVACLTGGLLAVNYQRAIARWRFAQVRQLAGRFVELHEDVARLSGSTQVRQKMVATALDYLDSLSPGAGDDPLLLSEIGRAYEKIAQSQGAPGQPNLGQTQEALRSFRKAVLYESRAAHLDAAYRVRLASIQTQLAYLAMLNARIPEARQNMEAAAALLDLLRKEKAGDAELLVLAAQVATNRGDLSESEGDTTQRLAFFRQAAQWQDEYALLKPSNAALARAYLAANNLAEVLTEKHLYQEALDVLRNRAPVIDGLVAAEPGNPIYLRHKMSAANHEGTAYDNESGACLGKPREAALAFRRYAQLAGKLVTADPHNASARLSLGIAYYRLSWPLGKIDPAESLQMARKSVRVFEEDLSQNPGDRLWRSRGARALRHLAYAYRRIGNLAEAHKAIDRSIRMQQELVAETPMEVTERNQLKFSQNVLDSLLGGQRE